MVDDARLLLLGMMSLPATSDERQGDACVLEKCCFRKNLEKETNPLLWRTRLFGVISRHSGLLLVAPAARPSHAVRFYEQDHV